MTRVNVKQPTENRRLEQHDISKKAFSEKPLVYP